MRVLARRAFATIPTDYVETIPSVFHAANDQVSWRRPHRHRPRCRSAGGDRLRVSDPRSCSIRVRGHPIVYSRARAQPFQKALDAYIMRAEADDKVAEQTLATATEWDKRSNMPNVTSTFAAALPVLRLARARGVPLVALGAPSEALFKVQRGGLDALSTEERLDCIGDPTGFVEAAQSASFRLCVDRVSVCRATRAFVPGRLLFNDRGAPPACLSKVRRSRSAAALRQDPRATRSE